MKLFPRGSEQAPILFEHSERTASAFFYFASRRVPHKNKKLYHFEEIEPWVNDVRLHATYYRPFMHHDVLRISTTYEYCFSARSRTSHSCGKSSQTSTVTASLLQIIGIARESPLLRLDTRLELRRRARFSCILLVRPNHFASKVRSVCCLSFGALCGF